MEHKTKNEQVLETLSPAGKNLKDDISKQLKDGTKDIVVPLESASEVYEDMTKFIATQLVANVDLINQPILKLVNYKDITNNKYRIEYFPYAISDTTADGTLPHGDITIDDFNADDAEPFTVFYEVNKQIYQKRQFNRTELFDMFKQGNGLSIVVANETKNIKNVIARRKAGEVYKLIHSSPDKVVGTQGLSTLQVAKLIRKETINLETPSISRLSFTYNSKTHIFEHQANSTDLDLVIDTNYENDKAFDIDGSKFNVEQFTIKYNSITRLDFKEIAAQYSITDFDANQAYLIEKGAIMGALIYEMSSLLPEPRFKVLREWAMRFGFDKRANRMIISFNTATAPEETPVEPVVNIIDKTPADPAV